MEKTKPKTITFKNGAVYDMEKHKIVANPGGGTAAFNTESGRAMQARQQQLKREAVTAGANAAVKRGDYKEKWGDLAYVVAISEVQAQKALTADPKSTDAARFVFQEAGVAESLNVGSGAAPIQGAPSTLVLILAELARRDDLEEALEGVVNE